MVAGAVTLTGRSGVPPLTVAGLELPGPAVGGAAVACRRRGYEGRRGVGLFAAVHAVQTEPVGVLLVLMVIQFFAEVFVLRNYALPCVAATARALLLGDSQPDPLGPTMLSRLAEVAVSCGAAVVVLWVLLPRGAADVRHARAAGHR